MSALIRWIACVAAAALAWPATASAEPAKPLFASDALIHVTIQGPIDRVSRNAAKDPQDATLTIGGERLPIRLSPRGITRLKRDVCQFAPLRVEFASPPPPTSLFAGQSRLKLVTHCRFSPAFQQHLLLEYAGYKLFNLLSPKSYRVRLASIDYVEPNGRPSVSRLGFFLEDIADVGRRNGLAHYRAGRSIATGSLSPRDSARVELFEYMISNYDWSLRAGPVGSACCHNVYLLGPTPTGIVPVPYDFDFSGLVDAPYATPPDVVPIRDVRQRRYRGLCGHNADAVAVAAEFRAKRPELLAVFGRIPEMRETTRTHAVAYLGDFFDDIRDERTIARKLLRTCFD